MLLETPKLVIDSSLEIYVERIYDLIKGILHTLVFKERLLPVVKLKLRFTTVFSVTQRLLKWTISHADRRS